MRTKSPLLRGARAVEDAAFALLGQRVQLALAILKELFDFAAVLDFSFERLGLLL
jgi:hypothetical protein